MTWPACPTHHLSEWLYLLPHSLSLKSSHLIFLLSLSHTKHAHSSEILHLLFPLHGPPLPKYPRRQLPHFFRVPAQIPSSHWGFSWISLYKSLAPNHYHSSSLSFSFFFVVLLTIQCIFLCTCLVMVSMFSPSVDYKLHKSKDFALFTSHQNIV